MIEFMDNHEIRLRRLETQEIGVGVLGAGMTLIEEITPTGTNLTFEVPDTYRHLQLRWLAQCDSSQLGVALKLQFNNDTTSGNYNFTGHTILKADPIDPPSDIHDIYGSSNNMFPLDGVPGSAHAEIGDDEFGMGIVDINYYTMSTWKDIYFRGVRYDPTDDLDNIRVNIVGGRWKGISAIDTIYLITLDATNFNSPSAFSLYGIA